MGKTFEALERAEKEFLRRKYFTAVQSTEKKWLNPGGKYIAPLVSNGNGWQALENKLHSRYPQPPVRTILVTGTSHGVGVSRTVVRFAQMLAKANQRKVLVVDANMQKPGLHLLYNLNPINGMSDLLADNGTNSFNFKKSGDSSMYVFTCGRRYADGKLSFNSKRFDTFMKFAREKFDYTILDSAPITGFAESQSICSRVDGTLLVVESGKTRRQVAIRAKKELEDAGGRLLGVILNKRKYYIPPWIYRRL
jgi:capsular exopolysaccharide synthesis family protein